MPTFEVTISRYHLTKLSIEASNRKHAETIAWDKLDDILSDETLWDEEDYEVFGSKLVSPRKRFFPRKLRK